MAPSRKRSTKSTSISPSSIEQTATALRALPEKEREVWSLREAISQLQEPIRTALDRGYTYEEVTSMLAEQGINISVFSLKRYLSLTRPKPESGTEPTKRSRRRKSDAAAETSAETSAETESTPADEEPTPKRRRKSNPEAPPENKVAAKTRSTARTTARKGTSRRKA